MPKNKEFELRAKNRIKFRKKLAYIFISISDDFVSIFGDFIILRSFKSMNPSSLMPSFLMTF